jgi:hypothetical protein
METSAYSTPLGRRSGLGLVVNREPPVAPTGTPLKVPESLFLSSHQRRGMATQEDKQAQSHGVIPHDGAAAKEQSVYIKARVRGRSSSFTLRFLRHVQLSFARRRCGIPFAHDLGRHLLSDQPSLLPFGRQKSLLEQFVDDLRSPLHSTDLLLQLGCPETP